MSKSKINSILLVTLAAILAFLYLFPTEPGIKTAEENTRALIGGPFTLTNHLGKPATSENFLGKYMLIYFGYTYCPDVCPMELQIMADALDQLPRETLDQIAPLFITIDPDRDTVEILAQYVPTVHPSLEGLTGTAEQIAAVKQAYRVYGSKEKVAEGTAADSYLMGHTSYIYLMDQKGDYVTHFRSRTDPKVMAQRLHEVIG